MKNLGILKGEGYESIVWECDDGRCFWIADFDIDSDGGSNPDGDKYWQPETALKLRGKSIDAETVSGIVVPGWFPHHVKGIVLGCLGRATNLRTMEAYSAVIHDTGPLFKDGEGTPFLAKKISINPNSVTGGEDRPIILFECWPGKAALVGGIQYDLQPC